jgi:hypothetical protein
MRPITPNTTKLNAFSMLGYVPVVRATKE